MMEYDSTVPSYKLGVGSKEVLKLEETFCEKQGAAAQRRNAVKLGARFWGVFCQRLANCRYASAHVMDCVPEARGQSTHEPEGSLI